MKKTKILIIEPDSFNCKNCLENVFKVEEKFNITTINEFPKSLSDFDVVILNSLRKNFPNFSEERIEKFVEKGGGLFFIHDTIFPGYGYHKLLVLAGIRLAFDAIIVKKDGENLIQSFQLAKGDPNNELLHFPVRLYTENSTHPIVDNITDFEIGEEFWAINTAPNVKELLYAEVGDRIIANFRFRNPIPIYGCRSFENGRVSFFLLGHYPETYKNPNIIQLFKNTVLWLSKQKEESKYKFDIFLSFSSHNEKEANEVFECAEAIGLKVFMSKRGLISGDIWDEKIRQALINSREVAILASQDSLKSEWVATEWGAAWALEKRITPILFRCEPNDLPDRLKRFQAKDLHEVDLYVKEVKSRSGM